MLAKFANFTPLNKQSRYPSGIHSLVDAYMVAIYKTKHNGGMKHNYSSHTHTNRMTDLELGQGEGGDLEVEHVRGFDLDNSSSLRGPYMAALGQGEGGEGGDLELEHVRGFDLDSFSSLRDPNMPALGQGEGGEVVDLKLDEGEGDELKVEPVQEFDLENFSLLKDPYMAALNGDWDTLKNFFTEENRLLLFASMTIDSDTALHIAAYSGKKYVLQHLVDLLPLNSVLEALSQKNDHGNNTFHEVATTNKVEAAKFLVRKLDAAEVKDQLHKILGDKNDLGETPVYRAAAHGHTKMAKFLLDEYVADKSSAKVKTNVADISLHFQRNDRVSVLHIAVIGQHFGLSLIHIIPVTFKIRTF